MIVLVLKKKKELLLHLLLNQVKEINGELLKDLKLILDLKQVKEWIKVTNLVHLIEEEVCLDNELSLYK